MHGCHEPSHNIMFISVEIVVWMEPNYGLVGPSPQPGWTKAACFPLNTVSSHNIMAWLLDSESYSYPTGLSVVSFAENRQEFSYTIFSLFLC